MSKWIEYTGSDEQIEEMCKPGCSFGVMDVSGKVFGPYVWFDTSNHPDQRLREFNDLKSQLNKASVKQYLICSPHPYADIIEIWARIGCEVYFRITFPGSKDEFPELAEYIISVEHIETYCTNKPDWNIPGAEYSLTPFEERKE